MEPEQIRKKVITIFVNERLQPTIGYIDKDGEERKGLEVIFDYLAEEIVDDPRRYEFNAPNVDLLRAFAGKLNTGKEREVYWGELHGTFRPTSDYHDLVSLSFETIFRMGKRKEAVKLLIEEFDVTPPYLKLLDHLIENIRFEYDVFDGELLDTLRNWAEKLIDGKNLRDIRTAVSKMEGKGWVKEGQLKKPCSLEKRIDHIKALINVIEHSRLKKELLEDVNWEINQDINKVEEKIQFFGLSRELSQGLREIEKAYRKADSEFDFKICVDLVRSFLENLNKEIMPKIENKCGIAFLGNMTKAKDVIDYFGKRGVDFLVEKEHALCRALYNFASDLGVHPLVSKKEYARISKNIIIELALLVLDRLEKYLYQSAN